MQYSMFLIVILCDLLYDTVRVRDFPFVNIINDSAVRKQLNCKIFR